jgi:hypothetical protein
MKLVGKLGGDVLLRTVAEKHVGPATVNRIASNFPELFKDGEWNGGAPLDVDNFLQREQMDSLHAKVQQGLEKSDFLGLQQALNNLVKVPAMVVKQTDPEQPASKDKNPAVQQPRAQPPRGFPAPPPGQGAGNVNQSWAEGGKVGDISITTPTNPATGAGMGDPVAMKFIAFAEKALDELRDAKNETISVQREMINLLLEKSKNMSRSIVDVRNVKSGPAGIDSGCESDDDRADKASGPDVQLLNAPDTPPSTEPKLAPARVVREEALRKRGDLDLQNAIQKDLKSRLRPIGSIDDAERGPSLGDSVRQGGYVANLLPHFLEPAGERRRPPVDTRLAEDLAAQKELSVKAATKQARWASGILGPEEGRVTTNVSPAKVSPVEDKAGQNVGGANDDDMFAHVVWPELDYVDSSDAWYASERDEKYQAFLRTGQRPTVRRTAAEREQARTSREARLVNMTSPVAGLTGAGKTRSQSSDDLSRDGVIVEKMRSFQDQLLAGTSWRTPVGDLAPILMTRAKNWPKNRGLQVQSVSPDAPEGSWTRYPSHPLVDGTSYFRMKLGNQHYTPIPAGKDPVSVKGDGYCFPHSVVKVLSPGDLAGLLNMSTVDCAELNEDQQAKAVAVVMADSLADHFEEFEPYLAAEPPAREPAGRSYVLSRSSSQSSSSSSSLAIAQKIPARVGSATVLSRTAIPAPVVRPLAVAPLPPPLPPQDGGLRIAPTSARDVSAQKARSNVTSYTTSPMNAETGNSRGALLDEIRNGIKLRAVDKG